MNEYFKRIIKYINLKVNYEVLEAPTGSVYLYYKGKARVRISNHVTSNYRKDRIDVVYIEDNNHYVVFINRFAHYFSSYQKVGDLLIYHFYSLSKLEENDDFEAQYKQLKLEYDSLQNNTVNEIDSLKKQLADAEKQDKKVSEYKRIMKEQEQRASKYKETIASLEEDKKELEADCEEAANLLQTMLDDPNARTMLTNKEGKKYFIDNFPEDVQSVLTDVIKEYYGK
jgi:DNA repair ATPase RecN